MNEMRSDLGSKSHKSSQVTDVDKRSVQSTREGRTGFVRVHGNQPSEEDQKHTGLEGAHHFPVHLRRRLLQSPVLILASSTSRSSRFGPCS